MPHSDLHKKKLKKNLTVLAIVMGICLLIWGITIVKISSAEAGEIVQCGKATQYDLSLESPVDACDIYTRQLAYRDEAIKLRQQIHDRTKNFAAPQKQLNKQYAKDLQALHDTINEDNIPSIFSTIEE